MWRRAREASVGAGSGGAAWRASWRRVLPGVAGAGRDRPSSASPGRSGRPGQSAGFGGPIRVVAGYGRRVLVGREPERARLGALIEQARHGSAGSVVLRGEPGVGKSALLDALVGDTPECDGADHPGARGRGAAGVRGAASAAPPGDAAAGRAPRPAGPGTERGVRRGGRAGGRAVPGGRRHPVAADRGRRGEPGAVRRRRRALARPGLGRRAALLRPPSRGGPGGDGLRGPRRARDRSTRTAFPSWS